MREGQFKLQVIMHLQGSVLFSVYFIGRDAGADFRVRVGHVHFWSWSLKFMLVLLRSQYMAKLCDGNNGQ